MKRLDRYVLSGFLYALLLSTIALATLHVVLDAFDHLSLLLARLEMMERSLASAVREALSACLIRILLLLPRFAAIPVALAGRIVAIRMVRAGETTAVQAAGMSLRRTFAPLLTAAVGLGLFLLALQEWVVPGLLLLDHEYRHRAFGKERRFDDPISIRVAENEDRSRQTVLNAERFDPLPGRIEGFSALLYSKPSGEGAGGGAGGGATEGKSVYLEARAAVWEADAGGGGGGGAWRLEGGRRLTFSDEGAEVEEVGFLATAARPDRLRMERLGAGVLGLADLWRSRGNPAAAAELFSRIGSLFVPLLVLMLVLPPVLRRGGSGATLAFALGLLTTLVFCFSAEYLRALAAAGALAAWSALLPHLLAAGLGGWMYGFWMER